MSELERHLLYAQRCLTTALQLARDTQRTPTYFIEQAEVSLKMAREADPRSPEPAGGNAVVDAGGDEHGT